MAGLGSMLSIFAIPSIQSETKQVHEEMEPGNFSLLMALKRFNPSKVFKLYPDHWKLIKRKKLSEILCIE